MPNNLYSLDASFPRFTGNESDKQRVGEIYDYLIQLQQTLRYCLQNLGSDNFNDAELKSIGVTIREPVYIKLEGVEGDVADLKLTSEGLEGRLTDAEGKVNDLQVTAEGYGTRLTNSEGAVADLKITAEGLDGRVTSAERDVANLKLTAEGFSGRLSDAEGNILDLQAAAKGYTLMVSNGKDSSTISLMAGEVVLNSQEIKFEGVVTFTADNDGYSKIDGGRIYSERIKTDYAWFTNDSDGLGHYINSSGIHFYQGKFTEAQLEVGSLRYYDYSLRLETAETCALRMYSADAFEMLAAGDITIQSVGGSVNLNGNVYVNGQLIS